MSYRLMTKIVAVTVLLITGMFATATPIPDGLKRMVAFIYIQNAKGQMVPNGTCFFVGVPTETKGIWKAAYVVTAKHVLEDNPNTHTLVPKVWIRVNKKSGGVELLPLPLISNGPDKDVYFHSDPTVDLALVSAFPDPEKYDVILLSSADLASKDYIAQSHIREGTDVIFTGMFLPFLGNTENEPVVRFGHVAMLPDERVNWGGVSTVLYLIESFSFGGNSGSPVFFYLGSDREPGSISAGWETKLAGVMEGFFGERSPLEVINIPTTAIAASRSNLGIAAVIPAYEISAILEGNELRTNSKVILLRLQSR